MSMLNESESAKLKLKVISHSLNHFSVGKSDVRCKHCVSIPALLLKLRP